MACLVLPAKKVFCQVIDLSSPDSLLSVQIIPGKDITGLIEYNVDYKKISILKNASVGVSLETDSSAGQFHLSAEKRDSRFQTWETVYGERKYIPQKYNELTLVFQDDSTTREKMKISLIIRAYNEGFAYRYSIENKKNKALTLQKELTDFNFTDDYSAWITTTAQGQYYQKKISEITDPVERPLTLQISDSLFVALGEAALVDFARMKFVGKGNHTIESRLASTVIQPKKLVSPWRYMLVGTSVGKLLEHNYFVLNLNKPNAIVDTTWIHPGKVIRETTLTTAGAVTCIDFAAQHSIQYMAFDAGWYGKEDSDTSDATHVSVDPARSTGPLDLQKVIAYGKQKNVGIILYVNRRALERQLDTLLPLYESWGIKGIKFGFVQVGSQQWTAWLHHAVRKAAKYHMMVDIHDEYRPTGYSRTYPNLMTQEGIRGDEESPSNEQTITTLFTRMIAGAADNTICYFTNRVSEKMGSHGSQLAKAICIYSPLQFIYWYDRPGTPQEIAENKEGVIKPVPELAFFKNIPTVWDETKVLEGKIGDYATIARRSGDDWFIGSLNGKNKRELRINCHFLDKDKKYQAIIYSDDPSVRTPTKVRVTRMKINASDRLTFNLLSDNGLAIHIKPVK